MARNTSADAADRPGVRQTDLKAIQELIGAIGAGHETVTTHLSLAGCDLYIFAVTAPAAVRTEDAPALPGNGSRDTPLQSGGKLPAGTLSLDEVISIICSGLGVARIRLVSKSRAPEVSLARALVAWHGPKVSSASDSQVAAAIKITEASMHSAVSRWRKRMPELFVNWDGFLKSSKMARAELREEPKQGSTRVTDGAATDAELGQRIARALLPSDKKS